MANYKSTYTGPEIDEGIGRAMTALQEHQDISGKENTSNKVTSLSSESTDEEYPSAKGVYDFFDNNQTIITIREW